MKDPLASLAPSARAALVEHLDRLRHDLGKYVSLQIRWSGDDPQALREAVSADLLATRRGPAGVEDASEIWEALGPELRGERALSGAAIVDLRGDGDFDRLESAMAEIHRTIVALRGDHASEADLKRGADAARAVTELCRRLWIRARE